MRAEDTFGGDCQQEEEYIQYSVVDERNYYRTTMTGIPNVHNAMQHSGIPLFISVVLENYEDKHIPVCEEEIERCNSCKTYLNPYVEYIPPGLKWKCNICFNVNDLSTAFQVASSGSSSSRNWFSPRGNAVYNYCHYNRTELKSTVYELHAPQSYSSRTPSPPFFCFLVEVTLDNVKYRTINAVVRSIIAALDCDSFDPRSKMMFAFFDSSIHLLKRNGEFTTISNTSSIPFLICDDFLSPLSHPVDVKGLEAFFAENRSTRNNYGDSLRVVQNMLNNTGGCVISFLSTCPNMGQGAIDTTQPGFRCKSSFYKELAASLSKQAISVTQFLFPRVNIEFPTLSVLSKYTGGMVYYYPNFDGSDPTFTTKLANDLALHLNLNIGLHGMCRVRLSKCASVKSYFGSVNQRSADLLAFSTFFPPHSFGFEVDVSEDDHVRAICFQVAILRTIRTGERRIRVVNFCIEKESKPIYSLVDPYAIVHALALKAFFFEAQSRGTGIDFLNKSMSGIIRGYRQSSSNTAFLPASLEVLPALVLALSKSIPLRLGSYTPMDYRSYYVYLLSNSYAKLVDIIIYPILVALHKLDSVQSLSLTLSSLETDGFYLLDTGVTIFFFIARACDPSIPTMLIDKSLPSGRFILDPEKNEFSAAVLKIIWNLRENRYLTPNYVLVRDDKTNSLYRDIFFTYFVEDELHGLPSYQKYVETLMQK